MKSVKQHYLDLLSLTQVYLLQEYTLNERIIADRDTHAFFRAEAARSLPKQRPQQVGSIPPDLPSTLPPKAPPPVPARTQPPRPPAKSPAAVPPPLPLPYSPDAPSSHSAKSSELKTLFAPEDPQPAPPIFLDDVRKIMREHLPHIPIIDSIPDDAEAVRLGNLWMETKEMPPLVILSFDEIPKHRAFLANIVKALEIYGIPAEVYAGRDKGWMSQEIRLLIASSANFSFHKEVKENNIPILLLSNLEVYFKEPKQKQSLWENLKSFL